MKIAELLTEAEFMEKGRMIETNAEGLHIQEKVVKAQAKFKIYEGLDQMLQKTEKVEVQEDKGISEHQQKHVRTVCDKTNYYNKNLKAYHKNGPKGIIWKRNENHEMQWKNQYIKRESPLYRLDLFIAEDGTIRVGGRLELSAYNENLLHPIVLPKGAIIYKRIIEWSHITVSHSDGGVTLN